jgi:hypothetical protein
MTDMVRKQIYLEKRQILAVHQKAATLGVNESEVIRQAIDHDFYGSGGASTRPDPSAWDEIESFLASRADKRLEGEPYQFNREEIYDDRSGGLNEPDSD